MLLPNELGVAPLHLLYVLLKGLYDACGWACWKLRGKRRVKPMGGGGGASRVPYGYAMWEHEETARQRFLDAQRLQRDQAEQQRSDLEERFRVLHDRQDESDAKILNALQQLLAESGPHRPGGGARSHRGAPALLAPGAPKNAGGPKRSERAHIHLKPPQTQPAGTVAQSYGTPAADSRLQVVPAAVPYPPGHVERAVAFGRPAPALLAPLENAPPPPRPPSPPIAEAAAADSAEDSTPPEVGQSEWALATDSAADGAADSHVHEEPATPTRAQEAAAQLPNRRRRYM